MNANKPKGRNSELPVDYNGVGVQVWTLGGETIKVTTGNSFSCLSSLIRVFNNTDTTAFLKYGSIDGDQGTPIGAHLSETFGCVAGEVYTVTGEVYVSFVKNKQ